jgi:hypothetical protein
MPGFSRLMRHKRSASRAAPKVRPPVPRVRRRGRPPKFGRPSQLVAFTLPKDVLKALRALHRDPAWAVVQLVESSLTLRNRRQTLIAPPAIAELVHLPGNRGLIVVQSNVFGRLPGISTIPLANGRAFLAFDQPARLSDLEVAILDKLQVTSTSRVERGQLRESLHTVRTWRRDRRLVFRTKSIIVVRSSRRVHQGSLGPLSKQGSATKRARRFYDQPR